MPKKKPDIKIEIVHEREMTKEGVETVARLLFSWWKRELEGEIAAEKETNE